MPRAESGHGLSSVVGYESYGEGMLLRHAIGRAVRRLRLQQGKTLQALATASRVSLPYLSEIERGRKEASSEILATVCKALDISFEAFLTEVRDEYSNVTAPVTSIRSTIALAQPERATGTTEFRLAA